MLSTTTGTTTVRAPLCSEQRDGRQRGKWTSLMRNSICLSVFVFSVYFIFYFIYFSDFGQRVDGGTRVFERAKVGLSTAMRLLRRKRSPLAALPQELHDAIIDHCHADRGTLHSCSRVCRSWLPASRYHVFAKLYLNSRNIVAFLQLITSPFCTIRPFVSRLVVEQGPPTGHPLFFPNEVMLDDAWFHEHLIHLSDFTAVRHLHMRGNGLYYSFITTRITAALRTNYGEMITDLGIHDSFFRSFTQFSSVIRCFPNIESLLLDNLMWKERTVPEPVEPCPFPRLRSLSFVHAYVIDLLGWLNAHEHMPPIKTLDFMMEALSPSDEAVVEAFFSRLGAGLEHLHLRHSTVCTWSKSPPIRVDVTSDRRHHTDDLSPVTNLRTVYIQQQQRSRVYISPQWISSLIASIRSTQLESIALYPAFDHEEDLEGIDWASIDNALSRPQFAHLEIKLCLSSSLMDHIDLRALRNRLHQTDERGQLQLSLENPREILFWDYLRPVCRPLRPWSDSDSDSDVPVTRKRSRLWCWSQGMKGKMWSFTHNKLRF